MIDPPAPNPTLADALKTLVGEQLSSVEFVADYVQLWFNGPCLTAHTPPTVSRGKEKLMWGDLRYRDALCEQIGRGVEHTLVDAEQAAVVFGNGATVSISLRERDYRGPEALEFWLDRKERIWIA
jgi:hypothetical protein